MKEDTRACENGEKPKKVAPAASESDSDSDDEAADKAAENEIKKIEVKDTSSEKKIEEILKSAKLPGGSADIAKIVKEAANTKKEPEVAIKKIEEKAQAKIV